MTTLNTLNNILNQSFQDEVNRYNNKPINTSENQNVSTLFNKLQGLTTDCNICYNETQCLQCYQCQFNYCIECMTKIISEYSKCSACQVNFINNYDKLEIKNIEIHKSNNTNNFNNTSNTSNTIDDNQLEYTNYIFDDYVFDDYYSDNEIEQITMAIENSLNDNNTNTKNVIKKPLEIYIEELKNNEILPYKITSLKHSKFTPNFTAYYDINKKLLIYCPHDNKIPNIELNYKIFNTKFQSEFRILLIHLLNFSNKFNNTWENIRNIINNFTNSYNKSNSNINSNNTNNINNKNDKKNITDLLNDIKLIIEK